MVILLSCKQKDILKKKNAQMQPIEQWASKQS